MAYPSPLVVAALVVAIGAPTAVMDADLQPKTVAAFDRYVRLTEARMAGEVTDAVRFLWVDWLPGPRRTTSIADLERGGFFIERLTTKEAGQKIDVPDGMLHHWVGVVFVPRATVDQAVALMQDYDHHAEFFKPAIARSKLVGRDGDTFRVFLRFQMKRVITVVVNTENEARFTRASRGRAYSRIYSTRIAEVEDPGTPTERERPVGHDGGYMWRLYTYWRFLERDGGTYVQCESISLSRGIPRGLGWLIGPFVTSIPRESLTFTLETLKKTLARDVPASGAADRR